MKEEKEYKIPESLILAILNYLTTQPYKNVVGLISSIQTVINKQAIDKKD